MSTSNTNTRRVAANIRGGDSRSGVEFPCNKNPDQNVPALGLQCFLGFFLMHTDFLKRGPWGAQKQVGSGKEQYRFPIIMDSRIFTTL